MRKHLLITGVLLTVLALMFLVRGHADADAPNVNVMSSLDLRVDGRIYENQADDEFTLDKDFWRRTKIVAGPNANAILSLDLIANGGAGNQIDDGVTSGTVSGQGTKIAVEVFVKGVTTALIGVQIAFDFDASVLTFDKAENSAFQFMIPEATGTILASAPPVTLPASNFIARAEFTTAVDVTDREFTLGIKAVTLAESAASSDVITTPNAISFNAALSPDFDGDGTVGFSDFLAFAGQYGAHTGDGRYQAQYDLDGNGAIDFSDFLTFASSYDQQVPPSGSGGTPLPSTPTSSFDLYTFNDYPQGITYANNKFYVVDSVDEKVYVYTSSGQRVESADFDLDRYNSAPTGITYANNRFYVTDWFDDKVYVYTSSGQRVASADFDLHNYAPRGITYANNRFYVVDGNDKVYVYTSSGQ